MDIAQDLEPILSLNGFHCAIGGSLVYRGSSTKDIDIFIYPHNRDIYMDLDLLVKILAVEGFLKRSGSLESSTIVPDVLVTADRLGRHVDFFFMSRVERTKQP